MFGVVTTLCALACVAPPHRVTEPLRVASAANFAATAAALIEAFTGESGREILLVSGATGLLYAQIVHGAPFDILLAADTLRPAALERDGYAVSGSRTVYAHGRLALWGPHLTLTDSAPLFDSKTQRLAIAKPESAPYGAAAREVLEHLGRWRPLHSRVVRGENVSQAFQLVVSGSVDLGFVALSSLRDVPPATYWLVPADLHSPIRQEVVLLRRSEHDADARAFVRFLGSRRGRTIIRQHSYDLPSR